MLMERGSRFTGTRRVRRRFADGAKNMPEVKTVTGADLGKTVRSSQAFPEPTTAFRRTWIKAMRLAR